MLALPWRNVDVNEIVIAGLRIELEEGDSKNGVDSTGSIVWDASVMLARYLEKRKSSFDFTHVLELGSGTGLLSIAIAFLSDNSLCTATDLPQSVALIERNVKLNNVQDRVTTMALEWGQSTISIDPSIPSLVCAADVVYSSETLLVFVSELARYSCCRIVLNKERSRQLMGEFETAMTRIGLSWKRLAFEDDAYVLHLIE